MSRSTYVGIVLVAACGLSGCAAPARVIQQDAVSVVVAVPDNTNTWPYYYRDEATKTAKEYLPDAYLDSTSRVKVGASVTNAQNVDRRDIGGENNKPRVGEVVSSTNTTTVSDNYEYHLMFRTRGLTRGQGYLPMGPGGAAPPVPGGPVMQSGFQRPAPQGFDPRSVPPVSPPGNIPPAGFPATGLPPQ